MRTSPRGRPPWKTRSLLRVVCARSAAFGGGSIPRGRRSRCFQACLPQFAVEDKSRQKYHSLPDFATIEGRVMSTVPEQSPASQSTEAGAVGWAVIRRLFGRRWISHASTIVSVRLSNRCEGETAPLGANLRPKSYRARTLSTRHSCSYPDAPRSPARSTHGGGG